MTRPKDPTELELEAMEQKIRAFTRDDAENGPAFRELAQVMAELERMRRNPLGYDIERAKRLLQSAQTLANLCYGPEN